MKANTEETTKAQAAFLRYLALGPDRSLSKLADHDGKTPAYIRQLERWSSKYQWVGRAKEHDAEVLHKDLQRKEQARQRDIDEMNERLIKIGKEATDLAIEQARKLIAAEAFGSLATVQLLKLGPEIERKARELPDQKIEVSGEGGGPIVIRTVWGTPKVEREKKEE